jgi:hypothetical protein
VAADLSDHTIQQWLDAERRIEQFDPERRPAVDRVVERLVAELRRRLGSTFTADELLALHDQGTGWCLQIASELAPGAPWAWDARVFDAAFGRYVSFAVDFAGGRRIASD